MSAVPVLRRRSLVALNPACRHGTGAARWTTVQRDVVARFDADLVETDAAARWTGSVGAALDAGVRVFIAAGGDGTVNALLNALLDARRPVPLGEVTLGAVGLGSSNDFHKPFAEVLGRVPVRLRTASARDVGCALYVDEQGVEHQRAFLVSASIGVTAAANAFFNDGDRLLRALKRSWVGGAIAWAALRTIARHRSLPAILRMPTGERNTELTNLSVMKSPWLSGSFSYDTPVEPSSGRFAINLCEHMGRWALLRTLAGLARGRFLGRAGTHHWSEPEVEVEAARPFDLELDGEVVRARRVRFSLWPERIQVCR
jgi:diacylglycerol kinase family enzyme